MSEAESYDTSKSSPPSRTSVPVAMAVMDDFNLDHSKVNVNGGAIALGHPIGASGARILTTLIYALKSRDVTTGLATLCIGGGEASAMIVERV